MKRFLLAGASLALAFQSNAQNITTYAGNSIGCCSGIDSGSYSGDGGAATAAGLYWPAGIAMDGANNLYIAEARNHRIRKVSASGVITTIAGNGANSGYPYYIGTYSGDGAAATSAGLKQPVDIAVDAAGILYICDQGNNRIRKVTSSGIITTIAGTGVAGHSGDGGTGTAANIIAKAICVDAVGNVYISEGTYIRKVNTAGIISTVAGNGAGSYSGDVGPATNAGIDAFGIDIDGAGNLYFADNQNNVVRKVNTSGIISTVAGTGVQGYSGDGGQATAAKLHWVYDVKVDLSGNLYVVDDYNQCIRKVNTSGVISTIAGNGTIGYSGDGGAATAATMKYPNSVTFSSGNLYISDSRNNVIRQVNGLSTAVKQISDKGVQEFIFPNPSSGNFTIMLPFVLDEEIEVTISDVMGRVLKKELLRTNIPYQIKLEHAQGLYVVCVLKEMKSIIISD